MICGTFFHHFSQFASNSCAKVIIEHVCPTHLWKLHTNCYIAPYSPVAETHTIRHLVAGFGTNSPSHSSLHNNQPAEACVGFPLGGLHPSARLNVDHLSQRPKATSCKKVVKSVSTHSKSRVEFPLFILRSNPSSIPII